MFVVLVLCLMPVMAMAQKILVKGRVVDAATGAAIPYANLYIQDRRGMVSDDGGNFSNVLDANDMVRVSCVGYETMTVRAGDIRKVIRMKGLSVAEVTVLSDLGILKRVSDKLTADYERHKDRRKRYFNRMTMVCDWETEMVEGLFSAKSVANLRDARMVSGRYWANALNGDVVESTLNRVNINRTMEIGAQMFDDSLWTNALAMPLVRNLDLKELKKKFTVKKVNMSGCDGKVIYKLTITAKPPKPFYVSKGLHFIMWTKDPAPVSGVLYVDAETYGVISFEAKVSDLDFVLYEGGKLTRFAADMNVNINYTHKNGYAEVSSLNVFMAKERILFRMSLVDVDEYAEGAGEGKLVGKNLINTVNAVGYDEALMKRCNIIQRNEEEEMLAQALVRTVEEQRRDTLRCPHERVYMAFDNTSYFRKEKMWFKAFLSRSDGLRYKELSRILYVDFISPQGDTIARQKYPIRNFESHGQIILGDTLQEGTYKVRAYTRYMKNWGEAACFEKDIPIQGRKFDEENKQRWVKPAELDMGKLERTKGGDTGLLTLVDAPEVVKPNTDIWFRFSAEPFSHLTVSCIDLSQIQSGMDEENVVTYMSQPNNLPAEPTVAVYREPETILNIDSLYMAENSDLLGGGFSTAYSFPIYEKKYVDITLHGNGVISSTLVRNYRRVLLFEQSLVADYKGDAVVRIFNNAQCKRFLLVVEGVTKEGRYMALRKVVGKSDVK